MTERDLRAPPGSSAYAEDHLAEDVAFNRTRWRTSFPARRHDGSALTAFALWVLAAIVILASLTALGAYVATATFN